MSHRRSIAASIALALVASSSARAEGELLPAHGRLSASLATGVPFLAIGELAIGIDDGFALGLVAGLTPVVEGVGLRARGVLATLDRVSLLADVPVLYYPTSRHRGAWFLTRPTLVADVRLGEATHLQLGVGLIATANADAAWPHLVDGTWQTLRVGCVVPIVKHLSFFADAGVVLDGLALAGPDWGGGPPAVVTLGVTWSP